MKNMTCLMALGAAVLAVSACSSWDPTYKDPGTYRETETRVDGYGTKTTTTKNTTVYRDSTGNKRAVEQTETSTDPKGLFNKSTSTTTRTYN